MVAGVSTQQDASCGAADQGSLPRISPPPAAESTAARLQAQVRFAASSTTMLRWALIALVGGPIVVAMLGFLALCASGHLPGATSAVDGQIAPVASGTLFLCTVGTATALGLALPTAAGFRALQRLRLRRQVASLPAADVEAALRPLHADVSADTRKIVATLLRELRSHRPKEVAPAFAPPARGNEVTAAGEAPRYP